LARVDIYADWTGAGGRPNKDAGCASRHVYAE